MDDVLPSVGITMRFRALCDHYDSQCAAVGAVGAVRKARVPGLPDRDDWTAWNDLDDDRGGQVPAERALWFPTSIGSRPGSGVLTLCCR